MTFRQAYLRVGCLHTTHPPRLAPGKRTAYDALSQYWRLKAVCGRGIHATRFKVNIVAFVPRADSDHPVFCAKQIACRVANFIQEFSRFTLGGELQADVDKRT